MSKKMEGNEEQKRQAAREAREAGKSPSEMGATTGSSKQHTDAKTGDTHQERLDLKTEGKVDQTDPPEARPGSRDPDTLDHERFPRK
ncbi:MAG TPA: hypothetical protein VGB15_10975 [Longimicrobium sp.]|jgi:hypothetical protein